MTKNKEQKPYKKELDNAWENFRNNEFDIAIELTKSILKKYPDAIGAIALNSHINFKKNEFKESVKGFKECLKLDKELKNHGYFYYWIARVYDYFGFGSDNDIRDIDKANKYYKKALDQNNYPPDLIMKVLRIKETFEAKRRLLERGIIEFPEHIHFYVTLYTISYERKTKKLLDTLQKGYEITKNSTLNFLVGKYFEDTGDFPEAIKHYNNLLKTSVDETDKKYVHYSLGKVYFRNGDSQNALVHFQKVPNAASSLISFLSLLQMTFIGLTESDNNLASSFIEKIEFEENFYHSDPDENLVWFENEYIIEIGHILDFKILEKKLRELRKESKNEIRDKIGIILVLVFKHVNKQYDRFRLLKQMINEYSPDNLLEEYLDCYYDYFSFLKEKNKDIENLYKNLIKDIKEFDSIRDKLVRSSILHAVVEYLFANKVYDRVIRIANLLTPDEIGTVDFWFELAYSFVETEDSINAQRAYKLEIERNPESSASFNNLSLIYEKDGLYEEAIKYISEARKLEPDKELYERNFKRIKSRLNEKLQRDREFEESIKKLENETDFAISKLNYFIKNAKSESSFVDNKLAIANWMFPKLIGANKEMAHSLKEQWLDKGYLIKTNERTDNNVAVFFINPLVEKTLEEISVCKIDDKWTTGISSITKEALEEIDYFENILKINKINKKYKNHILRDYKELTINFFLKNEKATLIIAGSLTEYVLTYYCEKKRIKTISYQTPKGKTITKKLYDCVLDDLIKYFDSKNILKTEFYHLNNLSRIYRNYVHPGKELRDADELNMNKAKLCYIGVTELIKKIM